MVQSLKSVINMAIVGRLNVKAVLVLALASLCCVAESALLHRIGIGGRRSLIDDSDAAAKVFDVTQYGAKGDNQTDSTAAFMKAWQESCKNSTEPAKLLVPEGTFLVGPVVFQGPCKASPMTLEVKGTIKATGDMSEYVEDSWFLFERINGLVITGGGTFDGQGATAWMYNDCKMNKDCTKLPTSIKFSFVENSLVDGITSMDSKYFHMHITDSSNYEARNLNITAPANSPNTDGMHISDSSVVIITDCNIGTGDDCISVGQGVTNASISNVACGPGHGISIGSLGKNENEKPVNGIIVANCTLSNTTNGVRIKTWAASPPSKASSIVFQDIIMDSVKNPIIIDQKYGSHESSEGSLVQISDVHYHNIKGTSTSDVAVSLLCSSSVPCEGIELVDIDLTYIGTGKKKADQPITSSCLNAKATSIGTMNPPACQ